jgi:predicted kinase
MKTLHMMIGIAGSGKSTYSTTLQKNLHYEPIIISSDGIRFNICGDESVQSKNDLVFNTIRSILIYNMSLNKDIIYDATNYNRKNRKIVMSLASAFNYNVIGYYFDIPLEECKKRNQSRERVVPEHVLEKQFSKLKMPELDEGFSEIVVIKND